MRNFFLNMGHIFWFITQLIILVVCVVYIESVYYFNILPDKKVHETFDQTSCTITNKQLVTVGRFLHEYRADFTVSYLAGGVAYATTTSANGLNRSFTTDHSAEANELEQFNLESIYPCWYDPSDPTRVVLVPRHNWSSTFPLFIPSVIAVIMCYYLLRTVFTGAGMVKRNTQYLKQKREQK